MVSKVEFLGRLPIFSELYEEELEELALITDEYEFEKGAAIAYQRDVADKFYIVRSGRLFAQRVDNRGIVRETRSYLPGDYFKDVWLFTPLTHDMTVNAAAPGRMLIIEQKKFLAFLNNNPEIIDVLHLSEEARYQAEHTQAALPDREARKLNLLADEIVAYHERRTRLLLFVEILIPVILFVLFSGVATNQLMDDQTGLAILASIPALISFFVTIFLFVDWYNDYFVITNKHLVHNEYDLRQFQVKVNKVPIDQIQSVEILRPTFLQNLLNVGSAKITTASRTGVLIFDYIDDPREIEKTINDLRRRVRDIDAGRVQAVMRTSLEEHFDAPPVLKKVADEEGAESAVFPIRIPLLERIRQGVAARVEADGTITYRKHVLTLLRRTWWQLLLMAAFLVGTIFTTVLALAIMFAVAGLIISFWFIWRFEDWRNDKFLLTDRYVIDIDRQPFGFGESRKQAELGNVQNISADRPGFFHTIFNFGNVNIETAGATSDIVFENVVNPSRVQSDIFARREQFAQNQRIQEGRQRRKEYAVLIDAYQQAVEQNRLPERRTPPPEDIEEDEASAENT